ncbi:hypothetical protein [Sharpea azabuensis]|uniref:hypothetical protein n=1 Tax=Sharpea azabuensis TaxID=322505 RepID=UPI0008E5D8B7|nr:hypothetical protein [Sharpea azabuensis]SFE02222.1 hypothetical protein SAMN04487836_11925 [Sharpea azabuensis]SFK95784.1 hypothetical protein SAMN04487835_12025 [Sharpea azabuensis]HCJ38007.1 hypothetical protein [Erysipelotrichaceae bacterium]
MKKLMTGMVVVVALLLTACTPNYKEPITKVAQSFLTKVDEGDFHAAEKLCAKGVSEAIAIDNVDKTIDEEYASYLTNASDATKQALEEYKQSIKKAMFEKIKLNDDYNNSQHSISAKLSYLNTSSVSQEMVKTKANELSTAFINAHQQDLVAIYKKSGEQGMQQAVNEGIAADLINYLKTDYLSKMKYTKQTWTMKFVQDDHEKWTIKTIAITKG